MSGPHVYADISFLINFAMDFCILWVTARLAGSRVMFKRIVVAAFIGGVYAVVYLIPEMARWYSLPFKVIFSCLMIIIALCPRDRKEFLKAILFFYGINFMVAGASIATSFLFSRNTQEFTFSYFWLLGGIVCALVVGVWGKKYFLKQVIPTLLKFKIELKFNDMRCCGKGFLDTGNNLRDPLTNRPVIVAEYQMVKNCLPDDMKQAFEQSSAENDLLNSLAASSWANRLRLIPFTSIGKKNGILVGLRADEIIIDTGEQSIFHKNMVVGIYKDALSSEGDYQFLIPAEIVEKG